jgi:hypothetical protein
MVLQYVAPVRFTDFKILRSTFGNTVVVTVLEALFPVFRSSCDHVIVAKLLNVPDIALTVHVMVIVPAQPLNRLHIFKVNTFQETLHVDITNPVNHDGRVSLITIHVAVAAQALA